MKAQRFSFSPFLLIWVFCFSSQQYVQCSFTIAQDDTYLSGVITLIDGDETQYALNTKQSFNIPHTISTATYVDPEIFFAISGISMLASLTTTVSWAVSCSPTPANNLFQCIIDKERAQFYALKISYLIFEKDSNRRVVTGQTNFQQLLDQQQPPNNIVKVTMPFPKKRGYERFVKVFITGVSLNVATVDITINFNSDENLTSDSYVISFDMKSPSNLYTVDIIYWNAIEIYSYSNELIENDNIDTYVLSPGTQMIQSYTVSIHGTSLLTGIVNGLQKVKLRPGTTSEKGGLVISSSDVPTPISNVAMGTLNSDVMYFMNTVTKFNYYHCPGKGYDPSTLDCVDICPSEYFMKTISTDRKVCFLCDTTCKTCSGELNTSCTACYDNHYLSGGECLVSIKQSIINKETIQTISDILYSASKASTYTSAAMTFTSGFLMLTGVPLLSQLLTTQKAFYLLLININPPQFLYEFVIALSDKGILNQFSSFNSLSGLAADNSESKTIGYKFETEKIPSDIFINAGGGLTAVSTFAILFVLFVVLENSRLHKIGMMLYEKVACGIIVETIQVSIFIFTFSSMMCLTNFSEINTIQIITVGFCFILFTLPLIGQSILLWKYGVNNSSDLSQSVVKRVLVQKLLNECKNEKIYTRLYMVVFLTVECLIFPLIIVLARENPKVASFSMAAVQIFITVLTFLIRPFVHMRETVLLLVEQVIFSGVFVAFTILTYLLEEVDDSSSSFPISVDTTALIISTLIAAAVLLKPLVKLFRVIIILKDILRARMEKAKLNKENEVKNSPSNKVQIYPSDIPTQKIRNSVTVEPLDLIENGENVRFIESLESPATGFLSNGNRETSKLTNNPSRFTSFKSRMIAQS